MKKGLLVFGDINIDIVARVEKMPGLGQDANLQEISFEPGGSAASCAAVAGSLGIPTAFVGVTGDDHWSGLLVDDLIKHGVDTSFLKAAPGKTGVTISMVSQGGERTMYSYRGVNSAGFGGRLPEELFCDKGILHLSGFSFQAEDGSRATALDLMASAKEHGLLVSLDPSFQFAASKDICNQSLLSEFDVIFPNRDEAYLMSGVNDPYQAAKSILDMGLKIVLIKLGEEGCYLLSKDVEALVPAYPIERVLDATGAGDAFCAGFLAALLSGFNGIEAAKIGAAATVKILSTMGGRHLPPTMADVTAILIKHGDKNLADKINHLSSG